MNYEEFYKGLLRPLPQCQPAGLLSGEAGLQLYEKTLRDAAATSKFSISMEGRATRDQVFQSLGAFFHRLPVSMGKTVETASPVDILCFIQGWVQEHGKGELPHERAAPTTAQKVLSHLRQCACARLTTNYTQLRRQYVT